LPRTDFQALAKTGMNRRFAEIKRRKKKLFRRFVFMERRFVEEGTYKGFFRKAKQSEKKVFSLDEVRY